MNDVSKVVSTTNFISVKECVDEFLSDNITTDKINEIAQSIIRDTKDITGPRFNLATERVIDHAKNINKWHKIINFIVNICTLSLVKNVFGRTLEESELQNRSDLLRTTVQTRLDLIEAANLRSDVEKMIKLFDFVDNKDNERLILSSINNQTCYIPEIATLGFQESAVSSYFGFRLSYGVADFKNYLIFKNRLEKNKKEDIDYIIRPMVERIYNAIQALKTGVASREKYTELTLAVRGLQYSKETQPLFAFIQKEQAKEEI